MKVFKFGGASVKDADSVKNIAKVLKLFPQEKIIVVISAMGKMTNAFETLTDTYVENKSDKEAALEEIKKYHFNIVAQLFSYSTHAAYQTINASFEMLETLLGKKVDKDYNLVYDRLVCMGEIISTQIISAYLNEVGVKNKWTDARSLIKTDATYREGQVDFEQTEHLSKKYFSPSENLYITQGFIGSTKEGNSVTLGRDGSDYSAAIFAYCMNAESVTIWKDVPGVMNADPKWFDETKLIDHLSYLDATELSYYGATVIHPKTIKPLQNKGIPLYVKSFLHPDKPGTLINDNSSQLPIPCFIFKINQLLLSISPKDFSFIGENNLSDIFQIFSQNRVKINTMENSAISFSVCVDFDERKIPKLLEELKQKFNVLYNDRLELITIRYYDQATIDRVCIGKNVLLEHKSRHTVQLVVKSR